MSKVEFVLASLPIEELQKALHVALGSERNEIQLGEHLRISRDTAFAPNAPVLYDAHAAGYSGTQPVIAQIIGIDYDIPKEILIPMPTKYPILETILTYLKSAGCAIASVAELAKQIAPALGVSCKLDDPLVRSSENSWKEAKIEYEQYQYMFASESIRTSFWGVRDEDGLIRHLISVSHVDEKVAIVPLTFAQHPKFRQPLACNFIFSPEWWLMGCELLKLYPEAEVWITNTWGCFNTSFENPQQRIFLGYYFGAEMISHLKLDCLRGRDAIKVLIVSETDVLEMRRNVEEAILLMSRLKSMDIKAEVKIVDKSMPTYQGKALSFCNTVIPSMFSYYKPNSLSIDQVVRMAMSHGIDIPENLRPDRYGALLSGEEANLVTDFLNRGEVTTVTLHTGVDLTLVTCSIMVGLHNGGIFPGKWPCNRAIGSALFIKSNTIARHNAIFKKLSADKFSCYAIPCGNQDDIEARLYHIVKENGFNVFIFESRQIVQEYRKELQIACEWAQKHGVEIIIITTEEDRSAESFFCDIGGKDLHFWWTEKIKNEYIVEDRPLLNGEAMAFKITLNGHQWTVQDHAEEELRSLSGRDVKIAHERTENEILNSSSDSIISYRRK